MKCHLRIARGLVTLAECPPGLFVFNGSIGFKSEYSTDTAGPDAYCLESGEYFWGGTDNRADRVKLKVSPAYLHDESGKEQADKELQRGIRSRKDGWG